MAMGVSGDRRALAIGLSIGRAGCFSFENIVQHQLGRGVFLQGLARGLGGIVLVALASRGRVPWRTRLPWLHTKRNAALIGGIWLTIWAYSSDLPIGNVAALGFLHGLFLTVWGQLFLGEAPSGRSWVALGAGFVGALLIIKPTLDQPQWLYLAAVGGPACAAGSLAFSRQIERDDNVLTVMWWSSVTLATASLPGAVLVSARLSPWLLAIATLGPIGMFCGNAAVHYAPVAIVAPFNFLRLPLTMALGVLLFGETPDLLSLVGATIILAACYPIKPPLILRKVA